MCSRSARPVSKRPVTNAKKLEADTSIVALVITDQSPAAVTMAAKVTPTDTDEPPTAPAPARERVQSVPIPDGATAKPKEAKRAGHTVRMRISATSGGVGAVLGVFMVFSVFAFKPATDIAYLGIMCGSPAAFGLLQMRSA